VTARSPSHAVVAAPDRFDRRLIAPMVLGAILNPVNSSIIAISLVPIGRAFGTPASQTIWLVTALYVATAIGQPVTGRLVDAYGPRRLFLAATVLTGVAGVIGALAPTFGVLVVARVVLGFGTCAGYPAAMTLIRSEADRTGQESPSSVLTILAVSSQTIAVIGPTLGGLLIGLGGWRATLAVNIPLALVAGWIGWRRLPRAEASGTRVRDLDLPGVGLFAAALISLALVLLHPTPGYLPLLLVTLAAGAALTRRELRVTTPFLDVRVLGGNIPLVLTYARTLLSMTLAYAMLYGFTQWLEDGRGLHPSAAGLLLLPLSLTALTVSALTGRRPEIRGKLVAGSLLQLVAAALLLELGDHTHLWLLVVLAMAAGASQGLTSLANQNAVYRQADRALLGASSGLLRTFGYLGAMVASAATGAFFGRAAETPGLHTLAVFLLVVAGLSLLVTLTDRSLKEVR
jgi:MFS family permease